MHACEYFTACMRSNHTTRSVHCSRKYTKLAVAFKIGNISLFACARKSTCRQLKVSLQAVIDFKARTLELEQMRVDPGEEEVVKIR